VQLRLPLIAPRASPERGARAVTIAGETHDVLLVSHRRARRFVLRVDAAGTLRLTVPRGATIAAGLAFVARQAAWVERERVRQRERARPWDAGSVIWFRGERVTLACDDGVAWCGPDRIVVAGMVGDAVRKHLFALATHELPGRCLALAAPHRLEVSRVTVRNQRSRWGSCSPRGAIALNWRLIQMPPAVSDYVVIHELMHLRQPNHSRRFWKEVAVVCEGWREAERWLRVNGRDIL
jgi:predicted metal-dependent hydrolase